MMVTIKASGKTDGTEERLEIVVYRDGTAEYLFDGKSDYYKELEFEHVLREGHPIGGTYFPDKGTALYYLAALNRYFDRLESLSVDGMEEEIPGEEGVVY